VNKMPRCDWTPHDEDDSSALLPPRYISPSHIVAMVQPVGGLCAEPPARVAEGRSLEPAVRSLIRSGVDAMSKPPKIDDKAIAVERRSHCGRRC
jgi:hypothetical protein